MIRASTSAPDPLFRLDGFAAHAAVATTDLAVVFHAFDEQGHEVALHVARHVLQQDPEFRAAWGRRLRDTDIPHGSDVAWRAHPWKHGWTVDALVRRMRAKGRNTLDHDLALAICARVGMELDRLRAQGLVHGRVSPEKVLLEPDGTVSLLGYPAPLTVRNATLLTERMPLDVARMPIEQAELEHCTSAVDTYRLAVMAVELLTGSNPFMGRTVRKTEDAVMLGIDELDLGRVPAELEEPLRAALASDADDRPTTPLGLMWQALATRVGPQLTEEDIAVRLERAFPGPPRVLPLRRRSDAAEVEPLVQLVNRMAPRRTQPAPLPVPPPIHAEVPAAAAPPPAPVAQPRRWPLVAAGVLLLSLGALGAWWVTRDAPAPEQPVALTQDAEPTAEPVERPATVEPEVEPEVAAAPAVEVQDAPPPPAPVQTEPIRRTPVVTATAPAPEPAPVAQPEPEPVVEVEPEPEPEPVAERVAEPEPVVADVADAETAPEQPAPSAVDPWTGDWSGTSNGRDLRMSLVHRNGALTGTATVSAGAQYLNGPVTGTLRDGVVRLEFNEGGRSMTFVGTANGSQMGGDVMSGNRARGAWSMTRENGG